MSELNQEHIAEVNRARIKECANCQASFSCYTLDCWCSKLPHIMPLEPGASCMCESCLKHAIQTNIRKPI